MGILLISLGILIICISFYGYVVKNMGDAWMGVGMVGGFIAGLGAAKIIFLVFSG